MLPKTAGVIESERPYAEILNERIREYALTYVERFGLSVVPVDGKLPRVKWLEYQTRRPSREELLGWRWSGIGIITGKISNLVVVDCDHMDAARWFYSKMGTSTVLVRTRRGVHFYFRHPGWHVKNHTHVRGKYDIRGDGGMAVAPPSPGREWLEGYGLRHTKDLPVFSAQWLPANSPQRSSGSDKKICHPERYISAIKAISGQGGHGRTYKAACYLRDAGLSKTESTMILARWNRTNAEPPWSDTELLHKLDEVFG